MATYLGGGENRFGGVPREVLSLMSLLSLFAAGLDDATDANVDNAGSWIDAWLPWRCRENEAIVEVEEGREISWPMDGRAGLSSSVDAVLNAGRSSTCRIDGRRNDSMATGRGRFIVARAEAVLY
ncbi:hypothetical protein BDV96DRAFT_594268 [Lophiotrema nucula]|uniref:Uncharacterized protein n=1 Tax=Lophiotrema nucula TaxID=690887 RepID=A0A6A5ZU23_9PLEO|nr:hypothetical protein BDV96DRAFT_594268 [Lophiotrema nucula]